MNSGFPLAANLNWAVFGWEFGWCCGLQFRQVLGDPEEVGHLQNCLRSDPKSDPGIWW